MEDEIFCAFSHITKVHLNFIVKARKNLDEGYFPRIDWSSNLSADGTLHERLAEILHQWWREDLTSLEENDYIIEMQIDISMETRSKFLLRRILDLVSLIFLQEGSILQVEIYWTELCRRDFMVCSSNVGVAWTGRFKVSSKKEKILGYVTDVCWDVQDIFRSELIRLIYDFIAKQ